MKTKEKICPKCKKNLDRSFFRLRKNGHSLSWCKICERAYWRTSRASWFSRTAFNLNRRYNGSLRAFDLRQIGRPEKCYLCGDKILENEAEIDHVNPRANGGIAEFSNLKWTHRRCNRMKHDLSLPTFLIHIQKILNHHL